MNDVLIEQLQAIKEQHDYHVIEQYAKYPYFDYSPVVVSRFVQCLYPFDTRFLSSKSAKLSELCLAFYFERNQYCLQLAYEVWRTRNEMHGIYGTKFMPNANTFTGLQLLTHLQNNLPKYSATKNYQQLIRICTDLLQCKFIIKANDEEAAYQETHDASDYLFDGYTVYCFKPHQHRQFVKLSQPDRGAWIRGSKLQIYSQSLGGWQKGAVLQLNKNTLTVAYGPPQKSQSRHFNGRPAVYSMKKIIHRYDDENIQSSDLFIKKRRRLKVGSLLQVHSHANRLWCDGKITGVLNNILRVEYMLDGKFKTKYVYRWSSQIRLQSEMDEALINAQQQGVYQKGTKIKVYSNTEQKWINGWIQDTVPAYALIRVRYGKKEKLLHINSHQFRLSSDNIDRNGQY